MEYRAICNCVTDICKRVTDAWNSANYLQTTGIYYLQLWYLQIIGYICKMLIKYEDGLLDVIRGNKRLLTLYGHHFGDWYTGRWWVSCYIWYSEEGPGRAAAHPSPLLTVPNVTAHPSTASVPTIVFFDVAVWLPLHSEGLTAARTKPVDHVQSMDWLLSVLSIKV